MQWEKNEMSVRSGGNCTRDKSLKLRFEQAAASVRTGRAGHPAGGGREGRPEVHKGARKGAVSRC